jgi:Zn-dependent M28 family amino/carboxypeptidase
VKGKTVVMLVNDPGFHTGDEKLFDGKRMTYYGRWTYKFEEAARQGAVRRADHPRHAGAILRLGRGQEQLVRRAVRPAAKDDPEPRVPAAGLDHRRVPQAPVQGRRARPRQAARGRQQARLQAVPLNATFGWR